MKEEKTLLYFETSALNWVIKKLCDHDFESTRIVQIFKNRRWCLSCVTLWELFLTTKEEERYKIVNSARLLFDPFLVPSPEELIVNYLRNNCPIYEKKYPFISKGVFSEEWAHSCKNLSYLFHPSKRDLNIRTKFLRSLWRAIQAYDTNSLEIFDQLSASISNEIFINQLFSKLINKLSTNYYTKDEELHLKKAIFFALLIVCSGLLFDMKTIETFWASLKIENLKDRIQYLIECQPHLFNRGPLSNIVKMFTVQRGKTNRGAFFDALHCAYIDYVDFFITNDRHFSCISQNFHDPNDFKIIFVNQLTWKRSQFA